MVKHILTWIALLLPSMSWPQTYPFFPPPGVTYDSTNHTITSNEPVGVLKPGFSVNGDSTSAPAYELIDNASAANNKRWWWVASGVMGFYAVDDTGTPGQSGIQLSRSGTNITQSLLTAGSKNIGVNSTGTVQVNGSVGLSGQPIISAGTGANATYGAVDLSNTNAIANTLGVVNGGTGTNTSTGTGSVVLSNSPVLVSPNLDTPSAINLVNATGLTYAGLPAQATSTTLCNVSGSTGAPSACNPAQMTVMMRAQLVVDFICITNITLSGIQTCDGATTGNGLSGLVIGQTGNITNGIYISNSSSSWARDTSMPAGYVFSKNCDIVVHIRNGTHGGYEYQLTTSAGDITVGTTAQFWITSILPQASPTVLGTVFTTAGGSSPAVQVDLTPAQNSGNPFDCPSFNATTNGTIGDYGNAAGTVGGCVTADPNGHPRLNGNGTGPSVTGTGCSLASGTNTDNAGSITATGIDTCTLAFGSAFTVAPHCAIGNIGATVISNLTANPTTAHAIFATTAAGTFDYVCL